MLRRSAYMSSITRHKHNLVLAYVPPWSLKEKKSFKKISLKEYSSSMSGVMITEVNNSLVLLHAEENEGAASWHQLFPGSSEIALIFDFWAWYTRDFLLINHSSLNWFSFLVPCGLMDWLVCKDSGGWQIAPVPCQLFFFLCLLFKSSRQTVLGALPPPGLECVFCTNDWLAPHSGVFVVWLHAPNRDIHTVTNT